MHRGQNITKQGEVAGGYIACTEAKTYQIEEILMIKTL